MPRGRNDYETAQIQGRLWTPAVLRPAAWFDGSNYSTITNSATGVSDWADLSGNARTMSRSLTTWRPDFLIENKNGLSVVDFVDQTPAGAPDLRVDRIQMASTINVQSAYVALMRRSKALSGNLNFVFTSNGDGSGGGSNYDWCGNETDDTALASALYASANWRNGSNYRNGSSITITAAGSGPLDVWAVYSFLCIGNMVTQGIGNDRYFNGSVGRYGEILWFSGQHSARERLLNEGYLSWKWGTPLAADHPFANRPPLIGD